MLTGGILSLQSALTRRWSPRSSLGCCKRLRRVHGNLHSIPICLYLILALGITVPVSSASRHSWCRRGATILTCFPTSLCVVSSLQGRARCSGALGLEQCGRNRHHGIPYRAWHTAVHGAATATLCTDGGKHPFHPVPSYLPRAAQIRYPFGVV